MACARRAAAYWAAGRAEMLESELIEDSARLQALTGEWGALAEANSQPLSHPAWMLAWLAHLAPAGALTRVVAVREHGRLVGLGPFFVDPSRRGRVDYRLLGGGLPRISPLSVPGREWEVAAAIAGELARARPAPDALALESAPLASHWPAALREGWPGRVRPLSRQYHVQSSPTVSLQAGSYEAWLAGKSPSFRGEMGRHRRKLAAAGGSSRTSTPETLAGDVEAFVRLHALRWHGSDSSTIVAAGERMPALLEDVGRRASDSGCFRLYLLEIDGEPIAAELCAATGGEVLLMNGGWDERFARFSPSMLSMLDALEDAFARGDRRVDLGPGQQPFKLRMADGDDPVAWTLMLAPGRRLALSCARSAPMLAGRSLRAMTKRAVPARQVDRLRALRNRLERR
jgi:CelD/BcsL family acetyltransferase involved in cellulose biosynthesis